MSNPQFTPLQHQAEYLVGLSADEARRQPGLVQQRVIGALVQLQLGHFFAADRSQVGECCFGMFLFFFFFRCFGVSLFRYLFSIPFSHCLAGD